MPPVLSHQSAADRHQIFEQIALERLRSGSDTSKPVSFLPLPVRMTAISAAAITGLSLIWAFVARVPVQVNGVASITPEVQVSSALAMIDGEVAYQVSGVGPNRLSQGQRQRNRDLSQYWGEDWKDTFAGFDRLNKLALYALDTDQGQSLQMPESANGNEAVDNLSQSNTAIDKLHFKSNAIIARIDNAAAQQDLDAIRLTSQPKIVIDQSIARDRRQRSSEYTDMDTILGRQLLLQKQELGDREALFSRLQALWSKGFVSTAQLLQEQALINGLRSQIIQLDRDRLNTKFNSNDQRQQEAQSNLNSLQTQNQLQAALVSYIAKSYLIAPSTGMYIVSKSIRNGMQVRAGDELYTYSVDRPTLPRVVPVFVNAETSQQLSEGMEILLTPKGVSRAEYGGIPGVVVEVGKLPLPLEGVAAFAGGRTLAGNIQQNVSTVYLARVRLQQADPAYCQQMLSFRCYRWSTKKRPPYPVRLGTLADVQINVNYKRPVEFVMPALRQILGLVVDNR